MKKTLLALMVVGTVLAACSSPSTPEAAAATTTRSVQVVKHKHVYKRAHPRRTHSNT